MDSSLLADCRAGFSLPGTGVISTFHGHGLPYFLAYHNRFDIPKLAGSSSSYTCYGSWRRSRSSEFPRLDLLPFAANGTTNSVPLREGIYTVGDFMTRKEQLHVVRPTTTADEALETLVDKRVTGFPVIDDDWNRMKVGVVSDYDLLALDSISGGGQHDTNMFPVVDSSWKTFNEIQKLLSKTNGKLVGALMTPAPLVVRHNTNLVDAARLLLQTKYRRLPVVDVEEKLIGIITRGDVIKAALEIKQEDEKM